LALAPIEQRRAARAFKQRRGSWLDRQHVSSSFGNRPGQPTPVA
jgi:hypothetical protein